LEIVDLDKDGELDIVYSNWRDIQYLKNTNGLFQDIQVFNRPGNSIINFEVLDEDLDGDLDFIITKYLNYRAEIIKDTGNFSFAYTGAITALNWSRIEEIIMYDIDKDGMKEAIVSSGYDIKTSVFNRNSNGSYTAHPAQMGYGSSEWSVGNVDNDTFPDFVSNSRWIEHNTSGGYISNYSNVGTDEMDMVDLDADGDDDVIGLDINNNRLIYSENDHANGNGFLPYVLIDSVVGSELVLADLNNDNLKDIIILSYSENKIMWYQNMGGNQFSNMILISDSLIRPVHVKIFDVDNDGKNDIVVAADGSGNIATNRISWFKNNLVITHFNDNELKQTHTIFPNPANDRISISSKGEQFRYSMYNMNGELILSGRTARDINIEHCTLGIYMLQIHSERGQSMHKVVVNNQH
jgi:hypothetical protein